MTDRWLRLRTIVSTDEDVRILVLKVAVEKFLGLLHCDVHVAVHARQDTYCAQQSCTSKSEEGVEVSKREG